ncbi:MAG: LptA/OstA family protein [Myxococcaceae bacterium]
MIEHFLAALLLTRGVMAPHPVVTPDAGTTQKLSPELAKEPVQISGDQFEIQGKANTATYSGHVKVLVPNKGATLQCDKLVAHYTSAQEVSRIECIGNAEATQGDKWARGDRADFDNTSGIVVITGNPQARQGGSEVTGDRFVIDLVGDTLKGEAVKTIAAPTTPMGDRGKLPVQIVGDRFEVQGRKNTASWSGRVRVRRGPTQITCDRLVAHYGEDQQLRSAECVGNATAIDGDKWAHGERAVYDVPQGLITVTGNPEAKQGPNRMTATKFVIDLPGDTIRGDNVKMQVETGPGGMKLPQGPKKDGAP